MLDWAIAAFMKRRSRMVEVMAAVPTAAQAAWRVNWRRVRALKGLGSIEFSNQYSVISSQYSAICDQSSSVHFCMVKSGELMSKLATARTRSRIWGKVRELV